MKIGFIILTSITAFNNYVDAIIAVNRINSTKVATELSFSTEHIKFKIFNCTIMKISHYHFVSIDMVLPNVIFAMPHLNIA
jgi:hypothetical protein